MSIDLRAFSYALEPLRRKQQWQLDSLQAQLGKAQRALDLAEQELRDMQAAFDGASADAAMAAHFDPRRHQGSLAYLLQCRRQMETSRERLQELREKRDDLSRSCLSMQQALETTEAHRRRCLEEYAHAEQSRQAAEADRDWIAREHWRKQSQPADNTLHSSIMENMQ